MPKGKEQGACAGPARGAAKHLHPGLEDAQQGVDDGGGGRPRPRCGEAGHLEVTKRLPPSTPWEPHAGQASGLTSAGSLYHAAQRRETGPRSDGPTPSGWVSAGGGGCCPGRGCQ